MPMVSGVFVPPKTVGMKICGHSRDYICCCDLPLNPKYMNMREINERKRLIREEEEYWKLGV